MYLRYKKSRHFRVYFLGLSSEKEISGYIT